MLQDQKNMLNHNYASRPTSTKRAHTAFYKTRLLSVIVLAVLLGLGAFHFRHSTKAQSVNLKTSATTKAAQPSTPTATTSTPITPVAATPPSACASNASGQLALVSISQRHLWACNGTTVAYDSAVVTGQEKLAADLTPTGTYHVYAKYTDVDLKGSDSTGSWDDHVSYWMPFLHNQYGSYGFHDATWRALSDFGNISPYSSTASHGCVELPLATATWLFNWAQVGTTVTIES